MARTVRAQAATALAVVEREQRFHVEPHQLTVADHVSVIAHRE
jgi:hypothetical protein